METMLGYWSLVAVDPHAPDTLYTATNNVYRSDDGGQTWTTPGQFIAGSGMTAMAVDGGDSSIVYAAMAPTPRGNGIAPILPNDGGLFRSTDAGRSFAAVLPTAYVADILSDPSTPGVAYGRTGSIIQTTDFGAHWKAIATDTNYRAMAFHGPGELEAMKTDGSIYRVGDAVTQIGAISAYSVQTFAHVGGTFHVGAASSNNVYVMRLDNSGALTYATYWGGLMGDSATAVTADADGNIYVVGNAGSPDFPQRNGMGPFTGSNDAFAMKFASDGTLAYSTVWSGTGRDFAVAASAGAGRVVLTGLTGEGRMFVVGLR